LDVIKVAFCHRKKLVDSDTWVPKKLIDSDTWVTKVLSVVSFDMQQSMFKLAMKSNACATMVKLLDVNPLTQLWHILLAFRILAYAFPEYFKLVAIAMEQVFGSVKDEHCFSSLAFCKSKLRNRLLTNLGSVVIMFSQKFYTLHNFLCVSTYEEWHVECPQYGVGA